MYPDNRNCTRLKSPQGCIRRRQQPRESETLREMKNAHKLAMKPESHDCHTEKWKRVKPYEQNHQPGSHVGRGSRRIQWKYNDVVSVYGDSTQRHDGTLSVGG